MAQLASDYEKVRQLIYTIAFAQDTLDWQLFRTSWVQNELIDFDLSGHLEGYDVRQVSVEELGRLSHEALSGFDCSQHVVTNIVIDFNKVEMDRAVPSSSEASPSVGPKIRTANARAIITAFHYLDLTRFEDKHAAENTKLDHKDHEAIMRGVWDLNLVATDANEWAIKGISVRRLAPLTGNEELYILAKERFENGDGRHALSD